MAKNLRVNSEKRLGRPAISNIGVGWDTLTFKMEMQYFVLMKNDKKWKCIIFKCYSSEKLKALNILHEVVPTWYSFQDTTYTDAAVVKPFVAVSRNRYHTHMTNML